MAAVLADPLLQKLLLLRPNTEASMRIGNWLAAVFGDICSGDADGDAVADVLEPVVEYISQARVGNVLCSWSFSY